MKHYTYIQTPLFIWLFCLQANLENWLAVKRDQQKIERNTNNDIKTTANIN